MVMAYRGGFSTSKNGSFWHLLVVQVYLILNSHDSPLFKLLYGCYMDSHGSKKIFLFQAYSNGCQPNLTSSIIKLQDGGSCQFKGKKEKLNTHK